VNVAIALLAASSFQQLPAASSEQIGTALLAHMRRAIWQAEPGQWITYRADGGSGRLSYWRFALVGAEKDALGRDALWIELEIGQEKTFVSPLAQMRMLIAKPADRSSDGVTRLYVSVGADKPQEVSPAALPQLLGSANGVHWRRDSNDLGAQVSVRAGQERRMMTSVGTLAAVPVEISRDGVLLQRIWISYQLPLLHLVKIEMPGTGYALEVSDFGTGAISRMALPVPTEPKL
jgi:hypothetical protein